MGNRKLKVYTNCYLCESLLWDLETLKKSIQNGYGRILWDNNRIPIPLCEHHQREKELRRDEREDRLAREGYEVVSFSEPHRGVQGVIRYVGTDREKV